MGLVTFQTSLGALIGVLIDNYTTKYQMRISYLIPLGVILVVPVFLSLGLMFLPESLRHYIRLGSEAKTEDGIGVFRGIKDRSQLVAEIAVISEAWTMENARSETIRSTRSEELTSRGRSLTCAAVLAKQPVA